MLYGVDLPSNILLNSVELNQVCLKQHNIFAYSLFETSQSLFWASFGLVDLMAFDLAGIKSFTRFWVKYF